MDYFIKPEGTMFFVGSGNTRAGRDVRQYKALYFHLRIQNLKRFYSVGMNYNLLDILEPVELELISTGKGRLN